MQAITMNKKISHEFDDSGEGYKGVIRKSIHFNIFWILGQALPKKKKVQLIKMFLCFKKSQVGAFKKNKKLINTLSEK